MNPRVRDQRFGRECEALRVERARLDDDQGGK
jgi:hypothetical protein